jgi:hypothetical protein
MEMGEWEKGLTDDISNIVITFPSCGTETQSITA